MTNRSVRRTFPLAVFALCITAGAALAQDWPTRPITAVVPLGAGSASDIITRVVMDQVGRQLGQPIVVENRPGAAGTIGANAVAKSASDGYTILAYGALNTAHAMHAKLPYDTFKDLVPVISLGQQPLVIVTSPGKGYKTLNDMIAAGKAKPGSLNYSSVGVGSASHFGAARLMVAGGFDAQHLPFKGAAEAVTDVVADRSDFSVQLTATTLAADQGRQARAARGQRAKSHPGAAGYADHDRARAAAGIGLSVLHRRLCAGETPPAIVDRLHREIAKALEAPRCSARFARWAFSRCPARRPTFTTFFHDDVDSTVALAKAAKIQPQ